MVIFKKDDAQTMVEKIAITAAALSAGFALKTALEAVYHQIFDEKPPNAVMDEEVNWGKVIGWTVVSGLSISLTQLAIKRLGGKYSKA